MSNLTPLPTRALHSVFRYYSNSTDGSQRSKQTRPRYIFLAQLYSVINELGRNEEEISRMKNAVQDITNQNDGNGKQSSPLGCLSLQEFLVVINHGRWCPVDFIRFIAEYEQRAEYEGEYLLAKEFLDHRKLLQKQEETRQLDVIKKRQIDDKRKLVVAHDDQLSDFTRSWDAFMSEFEKKSQKYLDELNQAHRVRHCWFRLFFFLFR